MCCPTTWNHQHQPPTEAPTPSTKVTSAPTNVIKKRPFSTLSISPPFAVGAVGNSEVGWIVIAPKAMSTNSVHCEIHGVSIGNAAIQAKESFHQHNQTRSWWVIHHHCAIVAWSMPVSSNTLYYVIVNNPSQTAHYSCSIPTSLHDCIWKISKNGWTVPDTDRHGLMWLGSIFWRKYMIK